MFGADETQREKPTAQGGFAFEVSSTVSGFPSCDAGDDSNEVRSGQREGGGREGAALGFLSKNINIMSLPSSPPCVADYSEPRPRESAGRATLCSCTRPVCRRCSVATWISALCSRTTDQRCRLSQGTTILSIRVQPGVLIAVLPSPVPSLVSQV